MTQTLPSENKLSVIEGRSVFVYRNLRLKCFSIRGNRSRRVLAHLGYGFTIDSPVFKVSESGRQRVILERQKNVHAGISGIFKLGAEESDDLIRIIYDPYFSNMFFNARMPEQKIISARKVLFLRDGVYASGSCIS